MKTLKIIIFLFTGIAFALPNNETDIKNRNKEYLRFIDSEDREVVLDIEPLRIISLAPSITETVFALGAGQKLIGRTQYCDYPNEALSIESVGTLYEPNIEKIVNLNPDLILVSTHFKKEILLKLEELSFKVIIIDENNTINGVLNNITQLGLILNKKTAAINLNNSIAERIETLSAMVKDLDKPSVYYVISYGEYGDYTAGGDTYISELIERAGGNNIAKDSKGWIYSLEKIVEKNPEIIICSKFFNTKEGLIGATGYKDLPAVINNRVYTVDNNLIDRQGPRIADALEALINIIHKDNL